MLRWVFALTLVLAALTLSAQESDLAKGAAALQEFQKICDDRQLWGIPFCGRMILVVPSTHQAVINAPDPEKQFSEKGGLFYGKLPPNMMTANTSVHWGNEEWSMVILPPPDERFSRIRLLAHESFHRMQPGLKLNAPDPMNKHLDTESGRLWLRLELRALAQALRFEGPAARQATMDALLFRAARRSLHPGAAANEANLEIKEGLAEYTGTVMALKTSGESVERVARSVESSEDQSAFARSFAYGTGPALGLLLDRYADGWRKTVKADSDLSEMLARVLRFQAPVNPLEKAQARAASYGFRAISEDERERDIRMQARARQYRAQFMDGPVLLFPKNGGMSRSFNPSNLFTLGDSGTVYPTGTFSAAWGKLQIEDVGGLLSADYMSLRVAAPNDIQKRPVTGPGWTLELNKGWTIKAGDHAGDFVVVPEN